MSTASIDPSTKANHPLQCMEIWGGSSAANQSVSTPGLDIWVYSRPYQQADRGGDVHYVSLCGGGLITRLILADVSGHGASVGEMARSLRNLMRLNINRKSQSRLVQTLNRQFGELAKLNRFATAVVATYLTDRDELTVCNAGHPRPLWFRAKTNEWGTITSDPVEVAELANLPLGIDDCSAYPQVKLGLGAGDLVLIYTDALIEATGTNGEMLGEKGLIELLRPLDAGDPASLADALNERIQEFQGGQPAEDDFTFLLLHHNASEPKRLSVREKLDVYAKFLGIKDF